MSRNILQCEGIPALIAGLALAASIVSSLSNAIAADQQAAPKEPALTGKGTLSGRPVKFISEDDLNSYRKDLEKNIAALAEYSRLLEDARAALAEYRKALGNYQPAANAGEETKKKILEVLANGGLAVTAIFFGFFGFLVGALPGIDDIVVRKAYWCGALGTGAGVLISLGTSIFAILALSNIWPGGALWSVRLAVCAGALIFCVTAGFLVKLLRT